MSTIKGVPAVEKPIAIVGFMGAGKTTIGRCLAQRLAMPYVDTDREIERAFGLSIPEIFAKRGEAEFRAAERELISRLLSGAPMILSLGGGAYVDIGTRDAVNDGATAVWLDPPFELVFERLSRSTKRPLASGRSLEELHRLWNERRPSYACAHIRVVPSDGDPNEVVDQILSALS